MSTYTKYFGLLLASTAGALSAAPAFALINSTADELYSETIYIEKSSAEVPGSLESNGRDSEESVTLAANDAQAAAPAQDMEEAAAPAPAKHKAHKKAAKHRHSKK